MTHNIYSEEALQQHPGLLNGYLSELSEKVPLEQCLFSLLLHGEPYELLGALRFDAHTCITSLTNKAENDMERPGQDTRISVWTCWYKSNPLTDRLWRSPHFHSSRSNNFICLRVNPTVRAQFKQSQKIGH